MAGAAGSPGYGGLSLGSLVVIVLLRTIASGLTGGRQARCGLLPCPAARAGLLPACCGAEAVGAELTLSP